MDQLGPRKVAHFFLIVAFVGFSYLSESLHESGDKARLALFHNKIRSTVIALAATALVFRPSFFTASLSAFCDAYWLYSAYAIVFAPPERMRGAPPIPAESNYFSVLGSQTAFVVLHFIVAVKETLFYRAAGL